MRGARLLGRKRGSRAKNRARDRADCDSPQSARATARSRDSDVAVVTLSQSSLSHRADCDSPRGRARFLAREPRLRQ